MNIAMGKSGVFDSTFLVLQTQFAGNVESKKV